MTPLKPMLAKDADLSRLTFPLAIQPKLDGIRATVQGGRLLSRTLKAIPNAEIRAALEQPEYEGLDGELIVGDPRDADCYRNTSSFVMSEDKTGEPWTFFVFDRIDQPGMGYLSRRALLPEDDAYVSKVAQVVVAGPRDLEGVEALLIEDGYEGVIARDPQAPYKHGRSTPRGPLLKIKRFVDFEARVVGVYEEQHNGNQAVRNALGRTERSTAKAGKSGKDTLGGLVLVALNGPCEGAEFRCGTGFTAEDRAALWQEAHADPETFGKNASGTGLNGRVAKVKSFPVGVKDKPRHPVFLGWRDMAVDG